MNKKRAVEEDAAKTYNEFKVFEGRKYTGMRVGGRHHYDKREWNEKRLCRIVKIQSRPRIIHVTRQTDDTLSSEA